MAVFLLMTQALLCAALVTDLMWGKIPNCITIPAMIAGLWCHLVWPGQGGALFAVKGLLLGGGLLIFFFVLGGVGGGDVKLFAAMGALLGPQAVLATFVYTALAGAAISLFLLAGQKKRPVFKEAGRDLVCFFLARCPASPSPQRQSFPYSIPAAAGFGIYLIRLARGNVI